MIIYLYITQSANALKISDQASDQVSDPAESCIQNCWQLVTW